MKVCLINNFYEPFGRGGAEQVVASLADALESAGHRAVIITAGPERNGREARGGRTIYRLAGFNSAIFRLGRWPKFLRLCWHLFAPFDFVTAGKIKKIIAAERVDLVWTHNLLGLGLLAPRRIKKQGIKHYHTLHDLQLLHPSGQIFWGKEKTLASVWSRAYQAMSRSLIGSPDLVISPSGWLLKEHLARGFFKDSRTRTLLNPAPETAAGTDGARRPRTPFKFLFVGQLEKHKNILWLAEEFPAAAPPDTRLLIAGGGSLRPALEALAKNDPRLELAGKKSRDEIFTLMREADCLIVPSVCYENSPTVILEAVAAQLPVVASRIGGIPELLGGRAELLFMPGNARELKERLAWVIDNYPRALEAAADLRRKLPLLTAEEYLKKIL